MIAHEAIPQLDSFAEYASAFPDVALLTRPLDLASELRDLVIRSLQSTMTREGIGPPAAASLRKQPHAGEADVLVEVHRPFTLPG